MAHFFVMHQNVWCLQDCSDLF